MDCPRCRSTWRSTTGRSPRPTFPPGRSTGSMEATELRDGGTRFGGFGVLGRRRRGQRRAPRGARRQVAPGPARAGLRADRHRRHRAEVPARRQRDPGRLARGRAGPRRSGGHAALPRAERQRARAARAAGQPDQRRQARLERPGLPGVHHHPGRRRVDRRGAADLDRGEPRARGDPPRAIRQERAEHGRRGRLRARDLRPARGARTPARGGRERRARRPVPLRPRLRGHPLLRRRQRHLRGRRRQAGTATG